MSIGIMRRIGSRPRRRVPSERQNSMAREYVTATRVERGLIDRIDDLHIRAAGERVRSDAVVAVHRQAERLAALDGVLALGHAARHLLVGDALRRADRRTRAVGKLAQ